MIVTSRKDRQFDGTAFELKLKQLNGIEATKLISERFNFYIGKDPGSTVWASGRPFRNMSTMERTLSKM